MTTIYTLGHGSRSTRELLAVLGAHGIRCVVDVRAYPSSRRHPQFARAAVQEHLATAHIAYAWEGAALGGMREPDSASAHTALAEYARGFADHMASAAFQEAIARVTTLAEHSCTAIMCAEKWPSHCHRSFISDALTVRSVAVLHVIDAEQPLLAHELSKLVRIQDGCLIYNRGSQASLF